MSKPTPSRRIVADVARRLKTERIHRQISMTKLADESGLSQQMISYVERGMRNPTLDTLLRIASALKVDLSEILANASRSRTRK